MSMNIKPVIFAGFCFFNAIGIAQANDLDGIRLAAEQEKCTISHNGVNEPAIALTSSAYDLPSVDQSEVIGLLRKFLSIGCSVHAEDSSGTSPINVSILIGEPKLLEFLLQSGSDPYAVIRNAKPWANGKNSFEFAELVYRVKKEQRWKEVVKVLEDYKALNYSK